MAYLLALAFMFVPIQAGFTALAGPAAPARQPPPPQACAELFSKPNRDGKSYTLCTNTHYVSVVKMFGQAADGERVDIRSVKAPADLCLIYFDAINYGGKSAEACGNIGDTRGLGIGNANSLISSIKFKDGRVGEDDGSDGSAAGGDQASGGGWFSSAAMIDSWVNAPLDSAIYRAARWSASSLWYWLRSDFSTVLLIEHLRQSLATRGFRPLVDQLAGQISALSPAALGLGFSLAILSLLLLPYLRVHFASMRAVLLLALLLPMLLPIAGSLFQQADQARGDVGSNLYDLAWTNAGDYQDLVPTGTGAPTTADPDTSAQPDGDAASADPLPALAPLDPSLGTAQHAVDAAAAYLLVNRADVETVQPLPAGFQEHYFPTPPADFSGLTAPARQQALDRAWTGVARMAGGFVLIAFAFLESVGNLCWTLAFWVVALCLLLVALFAWLPPAQAALSALGRHWMQVFLASWGAALMYGLFMAIVFGVGATGNAGALFGISFVGLFVALVFTIAAGAALFRALLGVMGALTGGVLAAAYVRQGQELVGQGARPLRRIGREVAGPLGKARDTVWDTLTPSAAAPPPTPQRSQAARIVRNGGLAKAMNGKPSGAATGPGGRPNPSNSWARSQRATPGPVRRRQPAPAQSSQATPNQGTP